MGKSLNDIMRDIALLTLDIESLDPDSKHSAITHLEETIDLLKFEAELDEEMDTLIQENEDPENESNIDQGNNEKMEISTQQVPNNDIKQEPVNQEPVILSLSPDTFQGQIESVNDMFKCDPCDVYLPRSFTLQEHSN